MSFGPELSPEEQARRRAIVLKVGAVLLPGIFLFLIFAAFGGLHLVMNLFS